MVLTSTLLVAVVALFAARHVLKFTTAGFCLRHNISQENLYVVLTDNAGSAEFPMVYERRVRRSNIQGSTSLTRFAIPLDIEEFRRVSASPFEHYTAAVSSWFTNTYECRKDGRYVQEPLFDFRPLTVTERQTLWPRLLHETVQCERHLALT